MDSNDVDLTPSAVRRRLVHRAWAILAGAVVLLLLGGIAVLMISTAALWNRTTPAETEAILPDAAGAEQAPD